MGNHGMKVFFMGLIGHKRHLTTMPCAINANNRQFLAQLVIVRKHTTTYSV
jgi:hypothetical protein